MKINWSVCDLYGMCLTSLNVSTLDRRDCVVCRGCLCVRLYSVTQAALVQLSCSLVYSDGFSRLFWCLQTQQMTKSHDSSNARYGHTMEKKRKKT